MHVFDFGHKTTNGIKENEEQILKFNIHFSAKQCSIPRLVWSCKGGIKKFQMNLENKQPTLNSKIRLP